MAKGRKTGGRQRGPVNKPTVRVLASPSIPSWNQILSFLQQMAQLRENAGSAAQRPFPYILQTSEKWRIRALSQPPGFPSASGPILAGFRARHAAFASVPRRHAPDPPALRSARHDLSRMVQRTTVRPPNLHTSQTPAQRYPGVDMKSAIGTIGMTLALSLVSAAFALAADATTGTWKLNEAKSKFAQGAGIL